MLNAVSGSVPGTVVVVSKGNIPVEDIQKYGKYIAVLRNLGQLKENESPLVDLKKKTLVADDRYGQWFRRKLSGGFDSRILEEAFDFLRKCHKKSCKGRSEYREWGEEIVQEFAKVGVDKTLDFHKLNNAADAKQLEDLFKNAHPNNLGLKRVLQYYFDSTNAVRSIIARTARQVQKMDIPPAAPVAPPAPPANWSSSRAVRERTPTVVKEGTSPKDSAGSRVNVYGYTADLDAIRNGRGSLRMTKKADPKDEEIERQLASVTTAQSIQQQLATSTAFTHSQLHRPPSVQEMMDWEDEWNNTQVNINRPAFVVKKMGRSSVILDEKAMERLKAIKEANVIEE